MISYARRSNKINWGEWTKNLKLNLQENNFDVLWLGNIILMPVKTTSTFLNEEHKAQKINVPRLYKLTIN